MSAKKKKASLPVWMKVMYAVESVILIGAITVASIVAVKGLSKNELAENSAETQAERLTIASETNQSSLETSDTLSPEEESSLLESIEKASIKASKKESKAASKSEAESLSIAEASAQAAAEESITEASVSASSPVDQSTVDQASIDESIRASQAEASAAESLQASIAESSSIEASVQASVAESLAQSSVEASLLESSSIEASIQASIAESIAANTSAETLAPNPAGAFTVTYNYGFECFGSKDELYNCFYGDYYDFLVGIGANPSAQGINSKAEFLAACKTWTYGGVNEMGGLGHAFASNYVANIRGGSLESQPASSFIGWCNANGKYKAVIHHLEQFFRYWRIDEGYAALNGGPDSAATDFYANTWASFVDTSKFFYCSTPAMLASVYPWFNSDRVNTALFNVPGVGYATSASSADGSPLTLPTDVFRMGYVFTGWYTDPQCTNRITQAAESMTVYAGWARNY